MVLCLGRVTGVVRQSKVSTARDMWCVEEWPGQYEVSMPRCRTKTRLLEGSRKDGGEHKDV